MKDEALRLALEALEMYELETNSEFQRKAITAIKAALEAKDEPVAWRDAAIRLGEELSSVGPNGYYNMSAKEWLDWAMEQNPRGEHSLPQRTWVGLTDDDFQPMVQKAMVYYGYKPEYSTLTSGAGFYALVRNIEAKLKEKNT